MVPKEVMLQWQNELYEKFNLNVPLYDGGELIWRKTHGWEGPTLRTLRRRFGSLAQAWATLGPVPGPDS